MSANYIEINDVSVTRYSADEDLEEAEIIASRPSWVAGLA